MFYTSGMGTLGKRETLIQDLVDLVDLLELVEFRVLKVHRDHLEVHKELKVPQDRTEHPEPQGLRVLLDPAELRVLLGHPE
jgi:hypothetical protein